MAESMLALAHDSAADDLRTLHRLFVIPDRFPEACAEEWHPSRLPISSRKSPSSSQISLDLLPGARSENHFNLLESIFEKFLMELRSATRSSRSKPLEITMSVPLDYQIPYPTMPSPCLTLHAKPFAGWGVFLSMPWIHTWGRDPPSWICISASIQCPSWPVSCGEKRHVLDTFSTLWRYHGTFVRSLFCGS